MTNCFIQALTQSYQHDLATKHNNRRFCWFHCSYGLVTLRKECLLFSWYFISQLAQITKIFVLLKRANVILNQHYRDSEYHGTTHQNGEMRF